MKYCRYCSWCILGDQYYCGCFDKVLKRVDKAVNCKEYHESELGDVETGKMYMPRPRREKLQQINFDFDSKESAGMRVSQLLHAMDKDEIIYISDYDQPIDTMTLYSGTARGIQRDNPINKMHIISICADNDQILVLAKNSKAKCGEQE